MSAQTAAISSSAPSVREKQNFHLPMPQQVIFCEAGKEIYRQGEPASALYQIEYGTVCVYRLTTDGRRQICSFYLPGDFFGFEADGHHQFFAQAVCSSALRVYRLAQGGEAPNEVLPLALRALVRAQEHLLVVGRQNASERLAAFLLDMAERQGGVTQIELAMSRTDIGDYLGLTIETVSRIFSKFRKKGYLRLHGARMVEILKPEALRNFCA